LGERGEDDGEDTEAREGVPFLTGHARGEEIKRQTIRKRLINEYRKGLNFGTVKGKMDFELKRNFERKNGQALKLISIMRTKGGTRKRAAYLEGKRGMGKLKKKFQTKREGRKRRRSNKEIGWGTPPL